MQLYTVAGTDKGWHWSQHLAFEGVALLVLVILAWLFMGVGEGGFIAAIIAAPLITLAVFWRGLAGSSKKAMAERGRYYCSECWHYFEGDALRQITQ